jgi:hypothetical protein
MVSQRFDFLINTISKLLMWFFGVNNSVPLFHIRPLFSPMNESNPLVYITTIANKSEKDYSLEKAYIIKRNRKTNKLITFLDTKILLPLKEPDNILEKTPEETLKNFNLLLQNSKEVKSVKIKSKKIALVIFYLKLDEKSAEYWKNYALKKRIDGVILPDGKVIPPWYTSEFDWELIIKDDKNCYWTEHETDNGYRNKSIDFALLMENYRIDNSIKSRLDRGENIIAYTIIWRIKIFFFAVKQKINYFLFYRNLRECL